MVYNYSRFRADVVPMDQFPGPKAGQPFPAFKAYDLNGQPVDQSLFQGKWVVLEFGSFTCNIYASRVQEMNQLVQEFPEVAFYVLYIREAHPGSRVGPHQSETEKLTQARRLDSAYQETRPIIVDDLQGTLHRQLGNFPNSIYILNPKGEVVFRGDWNHPKMVRKVLLNRETGEKFLQEHFKILKPTPLFKGLRQGGWTALWDFILALPKLLTMEKKVKKIKQFP